MFYRRPPPARKQPAPKPGGAIAMMAAEWDPPAPGSSHGEFFVASEPEPQRPALQELVIEAPPWLDESGQLDLSQAAPAPAAMDPGAMRDAALAEMRAAAGDLQELPAWGPPAPPLPPLERPRPPEPDWEAEEQERLERERQARERQARELRDQVLRELLAEDTEAYPARKGRP